MHFVCEIRFCLFACFFIFANSLFSQENIKDRKLFLGANFGIGLGRSQLSYNGYGINNYIIPSTKTTDLLIGNIGLDAAYKINEDVAIGAYSAIGTDNRIEKKFFDLGVLFVTDLMDMPSSIIAGAGVHSIDFKYNGINARIGFISSYNVYLMLEANFSDVEYKVIYDKHNRLTYSVLLSFGYRIF